MTPHQAGGQGERDAEGGEPGLDPLEVGQRRRVEQLADARRVGDDRRGLRPLGVEHPEGVAVDLVAVLGGQVAGAVAQPRAQRVGERDPVRRAAHRVERQAPAAQPEGVQIGGAERDHLDVDVGVGGPDDLDVDLMVLADAPGLGPLVAERGGDAPHLPRRRRPVLDVGPGDRGGGLGPQRQVAVALVAEVVHLLADDVGAGAEPLEHPDVLEQGPVHEPVAEALGQPGERRDQRLPPGRRRGQHVLGADGGAERLGHDGSRLAAARAGADGIAPGVRA